MARDFEDGFQDAETAVLWVNHIRNAGDVFREGPGGLYDHITDWVRRKNLGVGETLADICCGEGASSDRASILGATVIGVDFSGDLVDAATVKYSENPNLRFAEGDATDLRGIFQHSDMVSGALMINGIFHLPPRHMLMAMKELGRITRGHVLITTVNGAANEAFAGAFQDQTDLVFEQEPLFESSTPGIIGNPQISGPGGGLITLRDVPFVMHPMGNLVKAAECAGLHVDSISEFALLPDSRGPGINLFQAIELSKVG